MRRIQYTTGPSMVRRLVLLLVGLALLTGCGGFRTLVSSPPPSNGPDVLLIGDSNLSNAAQAVLGAYSPTYNATVDATWAIQADDPKWDGYLAQDLTAHAPVAVVVQLGTNDGTFGTVAEFAAAVDHIMGLLPTVPVLWNNVRLLHPDDPAINAALSDALTRWPNLRLSDYNGHFTGHPEWINAADPLHLSTPGTVEYSSWTLAEVNTLLG